MGSVYLDVHEQEGFVNQMQLYITPRIVEVAQPLAKHMIEAHLRNLANSGTQDGHRELDEHTRLALEKMFAICGRELYGDGDLEGFLLSMATPVCFQSPLTARDRPNMPAGNGKIGSFPLP